MYGYINIYIYQGNCLLIHINNTNIEQHQHLWLVVFSGNLINVLSQFLVSYLPIPEANIWHLAAKRCTVVDKLVVNFVRSLFSAGQTTNMVFTGVFSDCGIKVDECCESESSC